MIGIFSDFGANDIYLGQIRATLKNYAPTVPVIDVVNDVPAFNVRAAAHLLCALIPQYPDDTVFLSVVDPQVGSERAAVVVRADDQWFVGPDNGLMLIVVSRAADSEVWQIVSNAEEQSLSFHGRDLFAPIAARIATADTPYTQLKRVESLQVSFGAGMLCEIIYVDHYGNALTGLTRDALTHDMQIEVANHVVSYAPFFHWLVAGNYFGMKIA